MQDVQHIPIQVHEELVSVPRNVARFSKFQKLKNFTLATPNEQKTGGISIKQGRKEKNRLAKRLLVYKNPMMTKE